MDEKTPEGEEHPERDDASLGGRPEIPIDEAKVIDLAEIGCTNEEIATKCKCSVTTLKRRFGPQLQLARAEGQIALRRVQHKMALAEDPKMVIWMGKQRLGQSDKIETKNTNQDIRINLVPGAQDEADKGDDTDAG